MFTGLVSAIAEVVSLRAMTAGTRLVVAVPDHYQDAATGESIAVSGVCLTVLPRASSRDPLAFDVSPETLRRTTLGALAAGHRVNLERALRVGDRFGGHIVSGHVDATMTLLRKVASGNFTTLTFAVARDWERYVVEKGSIALEGVSLTIAALRVGELDVAAIPHTLQATTLGELLPEGRVNVELDVVGKYVERLLGGRGVQISEGGSTDERLASLLAP